MKMISMTYGQVLYDLHISRESIEDAEKILKENQELVKALSNPTISIKEKENVINQIFPEDIRKFLKVVSRNGDIDCFEEIFAYYSSLKCRHEQRVHAKLTYVTKPKEAQIIRIQKYLMKHYHAKDVELEFEEDTSLLGGFILKVQDDVLDYSYKEKLVNMQRSLMRR